MRGLAGWTVLLVIAVLVGIGALAYSVLAPPAMMNATTNWLKANPEIHTGKIEVDAWKRQITLEQVSLQPGLSADRVVVSCPLSQILPAVLSSWQHFAANAEADNLNGQFSGVEVSAPNVTIDGASYAGGNNNDPIAILQGISANSIAVADISFRYTLAQASASGDIKSLAAADIMNGKIAAMSAGAMQIVTDAGQVHETLNSDSFQTSNLDIPAYYRILAGNGNADAPMVRIFDSEQINNLSLNAVTTAATVNATIGEAEIGPFEARPMTTPYWDVMREIRAAPKQALPELLGMLNDLHLDSYDIDDIKMQVTAANGRNLNFGMQHIGIKDVGGGKFGAITFDGLTGEVPGGELTVTKFELGQIDAGPTLNALQNLAQGPGAIAGFNPTERALNMEPTFGHFEIDGFDFTGPDGNSRASIAEFRIDSSHYVRGIPSFSAMKLDDLVMLVPGESAGAVWLHNLGYGAVDVSSSMNVNWNQDTGDFTITDGTFGIRNMFRIALDAQLHGVGREQLLARNFSDAEFTSVDLKLSNQGLIDKALDYLARFSGDRSAVIARLSAAYDPAIASAFGDGPLGASVQTAISQFLQNPQNLEASVNTPQPVALSAWKTADWTVRANQ